MENTVNNNGNHLLAGKNTPLSSLYPNFSTEKCGKKI